MEVTLFSVTCTAAKKVSKLNLIILMLKKKIPKPKNVIMINPKLLSKTKELDKFLPTPPNN